MPSPEVITTVLAIAEKLWDANFQPNSSDSKIIVENVLRDRLKAQITQLAVIETWRLSPARVSAIEVVMEEAINNSGLNARVCSLLLRDRITGPQWSVTINSLSEYAHATDGVRFKTNKGDIITVCQP